MGEFTEEGFSCLEPWSVFMAMDSSMELLCQFPELSGIAMDHPSSGLMCYSDENSSDELLTAIVGNSTSLLPATAASSITSASNNSALSGTATKSAEANPKKKKKKKKNNGCRRSSSKEVDMPKEVVHVRARRGQATDSHSLAERARREKINERMRCLQGLVPGCHKAMGIAAMLDEIINYVQSLQNQVQMLSMKLAVCESSLERMQAAATPQLVMLEIVSEVVGSETPVQSLPCQEFHIPKAKQIAIASISAEHQTSMLE
ncbi:hypothetical protein OPV22_005167 [Ensete ventricosum]|uniref:BHLH domain-containing protein n=1 Tax=Ensete ventricosum TaxID=4639 RepID=A0AAV8Q228_ENSVE|nr:hypothetical protein OPV22_005167 [Ensete ventricosum]